MIASENRFRSLIEQGRDVIQLMDAQGKVIYSSDSITLLLGYSVEDVLGADPTEFVHPEDRAQFTKKVAALMKRPGSSARMELRARHADGRWIWLDLIGINHLENPAVAAIVGNFRDISERKQVEQALAESEARLRFMAESMPQKIFTVTKDGEVEYFNPQWNEYTGLEHSRESGNRFHDFVHPDDAALSVEQWYESFTNGLPVSIEQRFRRKDGQYRWHLTRVHAMKDDDGSILMWIGSSTDIHDVKENQKRQEQLELRAASLAQQRQQLLELHKAKDEFISLASHQLRTPATGVKQYLGMLLEGVTGLDIPPDVMKMIQVAYDNNERQLKIVNDLLKVAYVDAGRVKLTKSDCNPGDFMQEILTDMQSTFRKRRQRIVFENNAPAQTIKVDCRLLRMVMENLIDNASKYSPEDTTITVTVQWAAGFLCLNVTDQGVGISRADQVRLFKKFARIENERSALVGGTGLGLYWAKQVITLHRGSIMVRSTPGKGSTFSVQLPLG